MLDAKRLHDEALRGRWSREFRLAVTDNHGHYRHANGDAVTYLLEDNRLATVGDCGRDFHAAVDRTRVHDQRVGFRMGQVFWDQTVVMMVILDPGEGVAGDAFALNAQTHDDVGVDQAGRDVGGGLDVGGNRCVGQKRIRADDADVRGPQCTQRTDGGLGDAGMADVADDGNSQVFEIRTVTADREYVEQTLCRVGVAAVTGVDDGDVRRRMTGE